MFGEPLIFTQSKTGCSSRDTTLQENMERVVFRSDKGSWRSHMVSSCCISILKLCWKLPLFSRCGNVASKFAKRDTTTLRLNKPRRLVE